MEENEIASVARGFLEALERQDWSGAVSRIGQAKLEGEAEAWRRRLAEVPVEQASDPLPEQTGVVSAEFYNAWVSGSWWEGCFPGVGSVQDLQDAAPDELMALYLAGQLSPDRIGAIGMRWRVLGVVLDGPDEAYAVFRASEGPYVNTDGENVEPIPVHQLLGLRRTGGSWEVASFPYSDWGVIGWRILT